MLAELERYYADYCRAIREEADALRDEKMPSITEKLFAIYENTGNRLAYEGVYFLRRKYLAVFGLKGILDGGRGTSGSWRKLSWISVMRNVGRCLPM